MTGEFLKLGAVADFGTGRFKAYTLLGRRLAIFREPDGRYYALEMTCKHAGGDLTRGRFEGDEVTCPRHGWRYDVKTGACAEPQSLPLRRFALKIEDGMFWVSLQPMDEP